MGTKTLNTAQPGVEGDLTDPGPQSGDVVLTEQGRNSFTLGVVPGTPQLAHRTSERLVSMARMFAQSHRVDCWIRRGRSVALLARYRGTGVATAAASADELKGSGPWRRVDRADKSRSEATV